jgi:hypothetical protein
MLELLLVLRAEQRTLHKGHLDRKHAIAGEVGQVLLLAYPEQE